MGSKDKVDSNNKRLSSTEKKMIWVFLIYSNFAHRFCLCTLKIQYLAVIQLSKVCCYAA